MICLVLVSLLLITAYTTAVCVKCKGVPYSISETFYRLEHKLWFGATMFLTAGLLMPAILEVTPESYQFTAFLACVGMFLVGAAPNFREGLDGTIHTIGAVLCALFSQVWVMLMCPWILLAWLAYLVPTAAITWKNYRKRGDARSAFMMTRPMFWVEIMALATTFMTLFLFAL